MFNTRTIVIVLVAVAMVGVVFFDTLERYDAIDAQATYYPTEERPAQVGIDLGLFPIVCLRLNTTAEARLGALCWEVSLPAMQGVAPDVQAESAANTSTGAVANSLVFQSSLHGWRVRLQV